MLQTDFDLQFIKRCFELAERGKGTVSPNPKVGSVIVKNNQIISEGWHQYFGGLHAERNAINAANENIEDSTLYCNLEPCCHTNKKTPPCVPLIIQSKISRIVISSYDPNPDVNGKGVQMMRDEGIEVITEVLKDQGDELNKFFFKKIKTGIPYIALKIATSSNNKITKSIGSQTWITGLEANCFVHELRSEYDAILVGAGTINIDNPQLTVRLVKGTNPYRVIIDGNLSSSIHSNVFNDKDFDRTIIFSKENSNPETISVLGKKGIKIFEQKSNNYGKLNLKKILHLLGEQKINSILVEGGADIFTQFISEALFDEILHIKSEQFFRKGLDAFDSDIELYSELVSSTKLGRDDLFIYKKRSDSC
ncbi:MAG: bifunctional diaminohydroxyphosphoribosylaminopyrimidine deaminase/5-amino-6-(5-phosphoribosylamino)uracil reductase RibD [Bacteroidota bacterium]